MTGNAVIHPGVTIGAGSQVGAWVELGSPDGTPLTIGPGAIIRSHTVIYGGSTFGPGLETGHHVVIRSNTHAGVNLRVGSYTSLEGGDHGVHIGDYVRIQGRCEPAACRIDHFARLYVGTYVMENRLPPSHRQAPPVIGEGAVLCANVVVMGGVHVGLGAFIAANTLVSRDVPAGAVLERNGATTRAVDELVWGVVEHPWTRHYRDGYPAEAQSRIERLHARILAACADQREDGARQHMQAVRRMVRAADGDRWE